jgi:2-polyprenyl-3-methyl-5-hydroxy-6-metoxy-1,4-benzoquinol methylase
LGAGTGALANRLQALGFETLAVDHDESLFNVGTVPFKQLDLNDASFHQALPKDVDLITAVEVIEHLESPVGFLRAIAHLLKPEGIAVVTTPNVDNVPSRLKFFLSGKLRMMDAHSPWHISPVFYDLFVRQYLRMTELALVEHHVFPQCGFTQSRRILRPFFWLAARILPGPAPRGETHVFVLRRN